MDETRHITIGIGKSHTETGDQYVASIRSDAQPNAQRVPLGVYEKDMERWKRMLTDAFEDAASSVLDIVGNKARIPRRHQSAIRQKFERLADRGNTALNHIFPEGAAILREMSASASNVILDIDSQLFAFPWELLYGQRLSDGFQYEHFWGFRYTIYRNIPPFSGKEFSSSFIETRCPIVGIVADQTVPQVQKQELHFLRGLQNAGMIAIRPIRWLSTSRERRLRELAGFLGKEMHIVHFACHTQQLEGEDEYCLLLRDDFCVGPLDFQNSGLWFGDHPLIVLNACGTSPRELFATWNMVCRLLRNGARGVIATDCAIVPGAVAAKFTEMFYPRLLAGQQLGEALFQVRRDLLAAPYHNPLGLLYALYAFPRDQLSHTNN